jgi:hypothetical protein
MSVCIDLMKGFDLECEGAKFRKYFQNVVLINRRDVKDFSINSSSILNSILFNLSATKTGYLFRTSENGGIINADFSKSEKNGIVTYEHKIEIAVTGINENSKTMLKQLDMANFFGAIQFKDGTIEIHGFDYGLKTANYTYTPQGLGGAVISLVSKYSEYDPPYVYAGNDEDFDNLFADIPNFFGGDFNQDFSDDFFIQQI